MDTQLYHDMPLFDDLERIFNRRMNQVFDRFPLWDVMNNRSATVSKIPMDITEFQDHYEIKADVPGFSNEDISIEHQDNTIFISGKQNSSVEKEDKGKFYLQERFFNSFSRSFKLPSNVNFDAIDATLTNGVLQINIPKQEVVKKVSKKIPIK